MDRCKSIIIDGVEYAPNEKPAEKLNDMKYVIIRTYSAGVFAGYLESRNGKEAVIRKSRNIWYWDGASSISQLATDGTSKPNNCKFPCEVAEIKIKDVIEIISCTEKARLSIASVKVWQQ